LTDFFVNLGEVELPCHFGGPFDSFACGRTVLPLIEPISKLPIFREKFDAGGLLTDLLRRMKMLSHGFVRACPESPAARHVSNFFHPLTTGPDAPGQGRSSART
jgi:hypothetical protein